MPISSNHGELTAPPRPCLQQQEHAGHPPPRLRPDAPASPQRPCGASSASPARARAARRPPSSSPPAVRRRARRHRPRAFPST
ncbi:hypothetical protein BRADI_4g38363v3 [Brachypodium distachyon]|uniref:Uncharacterized protein n=1 Tax=Brachypodium distachyon TaxID=15368 RepID=A0A2K2CT34_BRADI|nr:hypothetical protein BRADI_4g38363v3 [Brachypodium distachyon]